MAETVDEFFHDSGTRDSDLGIIAGLVQTYLDENTTSVANVSQALVSEFSAPDAPKRSEFIERIVVPLAEQLPATHERLVALLGKLKDLSTTVQRQSQSNNNNDTEEEGDGESHGDLKTVGLSVLYELQERSLRYGDPDPMITFRDLYIEEWANLNRFAALVHKAGLEKLSGWGQQTIEFAISRGGWRVNWHGRYGQDALSDEIRAFEGHAVAAMHWILLCGQCLYDEMPECRENWSTWIEDLNWITEQAGLESETRSRCQEALSEMERIQC